MTMLCVDPTNKVLIDWLKVRGVYSDHILGFEIEAKPQSIVTLVVHIGMDKADVQELFGGDISCEDLTKDAHGNKISTVGA